MIYSPAEIRDRWLNYGSQYAVYPSLWDGSLAFASGPLGNEGGTLRDYSGRTAGAVWSVGAGDVPKYTQASVRGQSFLAGQYDGNDRAAIGDISDLNFAADCTAVAWAKIATSSTAAIFGKTRLAGDPYTEWHIATLSGKFFVAIRNGSSTGSILAASAFALNQWYCVAVRRQSGVVSSWINAVPETTTRTVIGTSGTGFVANVGCANTGTSFFIGDTCSQFAFHRALSQREIAILARHPLAAYEVEVPRYWTFPVTSTAKPWLYARTSSIIIGGGIA